MLHCYNLLVLSGCGWDANTLNPQAKWGAGQLYDIVQPLGDFYKNRKKGGSRSCPQKSAEPGSEENGSG
jgi:hypothetical protein